MAYKRLLDQLYQKKKRLHEDSYTTFCKFWEKYEHGYNISARLPLK